MHMHQVNMHEAKTQLSKLVDEVQSGEEVIIARSGKPVARLVPYEARKTPRKPGRWSSRVRIAEDFDETPQEIIEAFEGGE
ncbi:MAG: type II toxin-antitoxin system Phd/YefM family antitoxin [Pseudomonadota bacterium]